MSEQMTRRETFRRGLAATSVLVLRSGSRRYTRAPPSTVFILRPTPAKALVQNLCGAR